MSRSRSPEELIALDRTHVWHPFTQQQQWTSDPEPLMIAEGDGAWLIDVRGRRFLDGVASLWVQVHGHRRREIDDAVRAQLDKIAHSTMLGLANVPATELAARLTEVAPEGLTRVFYSDNGSTAVEVALKMAFQYQRHRGAAEKTRFVRLKDAYHGDTIGSVSVGGIDLFHQIFAPLLFASIEAPSPATGDPTGDALAELLATHAHEVAALVVEPLVQGAAGMQMYPAEYLRRARALCDEHDILLIADEVATGFGRTGSLFACERADVRPDLMALAKGLTGGYLPLAATLATETVYEAFLGEAGELKQFFHGHTYTGNPLAAAAALASLELFETDNTLERLEPRIAQLEAGLASIEAPHQVRQCGVMVGIELVGTPEFTGARVCRAARDKGVILRPLGNVVVLMPPLCITEAETEQLLDAVRYGIEAVT